MSKLKLNYSETGTPVVFCMPESIPHPNEYVYNGTIPVANWHHGAMGRDRLLARGLRTQALRYGAEQWVLTDDHWGAFHRLGLVTQLPEDDDKSFVYVAMQRAKFVGEYGLSFGRSNGRPTVTNKLLSHTERKQLWGRGHIVCESPSTVAKYLAERIVQEGVFSLEGAEPLFERYIQDPNEHEVRLLHLAASIVSRTTNFAQVYARARKKSHLPSTMEMFPVDYLMNVIMPVGNQTPQANQITNSTRSILTSAVLEALGALEMRKVS